MKNNWSLQLFAEEEEPAGESFEELIHGRCKEEFESRVQKILDGRLKGLRQENEKLRAAAEQTRTKNIRAIEALIERETEIQQVYPAFDWRKEMENGEFGRLVAAGIDGRTAYEVVHKDELLRRAMQYASKRTGEQMARSIASRGERVGENGGRSVTVSHNNPRNLNSQELSEIRQRVMNGEKIRF